MNQYVGLDVSQDQTSICVVNERGRVLWQGRCATAPEVIAATLRTWAPQAERIGLESGPLSIWLCHALTALGLPVVCLDARHAKTTLSLQLNKSDANDAGPDPAGTARSRPGAWMVSGCAPDHGGRPVGRPAG
jgi:transposase